MTSPEEPASSLQYKPSEQMVVDLQTATENMNSQDNVRLVAVVICALLILRSTASQNQRLRPSEVLEVAESFICPRLGANNRQLLT